MWEFVIPDWVPPSLNKLISNSRTVNMADRRKARFFVSKYAKNIPMASGKRGIQIWVQKKSTTKDDPPNRDGRAKHLVDALVEDGLLRDDCEKWLLWNPVLEQTGPRQAVRVRLWDIEGDDNGTL